MEAAFTTVGGSPPYSHRRGGQGQWASEFGARQYVVLNERGRSGCLPVVVADEAVKDLASDDLAFEATDDGVFLRQTRVAWFHVLSRPPRCAAMGAGRGAVPDPGQWPRLG